MDIQYIYFPFYNMITMSIYVEFWKPSCCVSLPCDFFSFLFDDFIFVEGAFLDTASPIHNVTVAGIPKPVPYFLHNFKVLKRWTVRNWWISKPVNGTPTLCCNKLMQTRCHTEVQVFIANVAVVRHLHKKNTFYV